MRQGILKYFRKRFEKSKEEAEVVEPMQVPASTTEEEPEEYKVVTQEYALTLWTPSVKETLANESEHARLERELEEINQRIKSTEDGMLQMKQTLDSKFQGLVGELFVLRSEIEAKFIQTIESQRNEDRIHIEEDNNGLSDEESAELDRIQAEFGDEEAARAKRREERLAALKKEATDLYRKISMRTHPDRVKNKELHEIFHQATLAYDKNDYERLQQLWRLIGGERAGVSNLLAALLSRIAALRDMIHEQKIKLAAITGDVEYKMWRDYQLFENRHHVEDHYRRMLEYNIRQARAVLASMGVQKYQEPIREEEPEIQIHVERTSVRSEPRQARMEGLKNLYEGESVLNEKNENELDSPWVEDED